MAQKKKKSNESHCERRLFPDSQTQWRETWFLHVREDVVQLRSGADVAQEHVVDLWSEIFLGNGVILQQTTATRSRTYLLCAQIMVQQMD